MSQLKINPDLFLGSQELNRFKKFLDDDGFRKLFLQDAINFGLINNSKNGNFDNFRIEQGTNVGTIKHGAGVAVDKNGNIIIKAITDNIAVPNDNAWYWVKIKYQFSSLEQGTVSIDLNGNLTGAGTEFLTILRGSPNNPVKVKFFGSVSNTSEYLVSEVINDTSALLSGDFIAESNLQLIIVGAFTPDAVVPSGSKDIYKYDGCLMTLVIETVSNTPPTLLTDEEFVIARIRRNGATLDIQDKRYAIYESKSEYLLTKVGAANNPIIGVEAIKFNNIRSPRNENVVYMSWGFRSNNWTIDSATNRVTIISGQGGKFKDTTYFVNGDFDGWRLYAKNNVGATTYSSYGIIKTSSKAGSQINLILDTLDPVVFSDTAQELVVVPDAESIQLIFNPNPADATEITSKVFDFKINESYVRLNVPVYKIGSCSYNVAYKLSTFGNYRKPINIPSDSVGFLNETSWNADGVQIATNRTPYITHATNGFITITEATNAYANRLGAVETGDLFGITYKELINAVPIYSLEVGVSKQIQRIRTVAVIDGGLGSPYTLSTDHYINLKTLSSVSIKNGNYFLLRFDGDYNNGAFNIFITQDYVNSGDPGTILYTMIGNGEDGIGGSSGDYKAMQNNGLLFKCMFDGAKWLIERFVEERGKLIIDAGSSANAGLELGSKEADSNPYIDFNSHGSAASAYDIRIEASGGDGTLGNGTLNVKCGIFEINGVQISPSSLVPITRNLVAGSGLSGGGALSADRTFDVNVDNSTIEINTDALRVKDSGITPAKLSAGVAGSGLSGGGGSALDVNVDGSTLEISADSLRVKDAGITPAKLSVTVVQSPDAVQLYTKVIEIGDWNMDLTPSVVINHGIANLYSRSYSVSVIIRFDNVGAADSRKGRDLLQGGDWIVEGNNFGSNSITLNRDAGGIFDSTDYDQTGAGLSRGCIIIQYSN
jgi:hypothetical protein